jgi:hypothetical protein
LPSHIGELGSEPVPPNDFSQRMGQIISDPRSPAEVREAAQEAAACLPQVMYGHVSDAHYETQLMACAERVHRVGEYLRAQSLGR